MVVRVQISQSSECDFIAPEDLAQSPLGSAPPSLLRSCEPILLNTVFPAHEPQLLQSFLLHAVGTTLSRNVQPSATPCFGGSSRGSFNIGRSSLGMMHSYLPRVSQHSCPLKLALTGGQGLAALIHRNSLHGSIVNFCLLRPTEHRHSRYSTGRNRCRQPHTHHIRVQRKPRSPAEPKVLHCSRLTH